MFPLLLVFVGLRCLNVFLKVHDCCYAFRYVASCLSPDLVLLDPVGDVMHKGSSCPLSRQLLVALVMEVLRRASRCTRSTKSRPAIQTISDKNVK